MAHPRTSRWITVGGVSARLDTTDPTFRDALDLWLRPETPVGRADPDLRVDLAIGEVLLPAGAPDRVQGPVKLWRDGPLVVVSDGVHGGCVDLVDGTITLHAREATLEACWLALHRCLRTLLGAALAHQGRFGVHAGAVSIDGLAVLIFGPSGAGKSTLTTHLARAGAALLADDTAYVSAPPLVISGWPERSRLRSDEGGAPLLPDGKRALVPGRGHTGPHPPALLVMLGHAAHQTGAPQPVPAPDVMAYLLQASSFGLEPRVETQRIGTLAALAAVPALALPSRPALPHLDEVSAWMRS